MDKVFDNVRHFVIKLDEAFMHSLEYCEKEDFSVQRLIIFIIEDLDDIKNKMNDFSFDIEQIKNGYNLDIIAFIDDEHGVNICLDFLSSGGYLMARYKNIYVITNEGEIIDDIVDDILRELNE
jgi:hypothetical protein